MTSIQAASSPRRSPTAVLQKRYAPGGPARRTHHLGGAAGYREAVPILVQQGMLGGLADCYLAETLRKELATGR